MTWTMHAVIHTAEATQYVPPLPLGCELWAHVRGDPPTEWRQWMPRNEMRRGTFMRDIDGVISRKNESNPTDHQAPASGALVHPVVGCERSNGEKP